MFSRCLLFLIVSMFTLCRIVHADTSRVVEASLLTKTFLKVCLCFVVNCAEDSNRGVELMLHAEALDEERLCGRIIELSSAVCV